jgi:hypothetical protein
MQVRVVVVAASALVKRQVLLPALPCHPAFIPDALMAALVA